MRKEQLITKGIRPIVLRTVKPGFYKGLAANEVGKNCVKAMVDHLKAQLSNFSAIEVIKTAYSIHEEYAYAKSNPLGKIYFSKKYNLKSLEGVEFEKMTTKIGVSSRFLVEASLLYGGLSGIPSKREMDYIALLINYIVTWAKNLDLFYYSSKLFPDFTLEVTNKGDLLFKHDQRLVSQKESVIRKFSLEREKAHSASILRRIYTLPSSKMAKRKALYDKYSSVDEVYQSRFGYKFTDALQFLFAISDLYKKDSPFGVHVKSSKKLLKRLSEKTGFSSEKTEKIFENFEITKHELMEEGFPNWRFKRKFSLLSRPIVSVSMGKRKIYSVFGNRTPIMNMALLVTSLEGFLNLGKPTEKLRREKAKTFERDVAKVLSSFGFKTQLNVESPTGEIDIIAIIRNLILIVECKAPTFKIDARELIQDLHDFQTWEKKVETKVEWVKMNKSRIPKRIVGSKTKSYALSVEGVIVTHRPFYDIFSQKFDTVFWHDFPEWIRKLSWVLEDKDMHE